MDVQMPVLDRLEATRRIRAAERADGCARTPIIALTADAMSHQRRGYQKAEMDGLVAKPIEIDRLVEALNEALTPEAARRRGAPVRSPD
jgi:CheY-like chemotaxis protein